MAKQEYLVSRPCVSSAEACVRECLWEIASGPIRVGAEMLNVALVSKDHCKRTNRSAVLYSALEAGGSCSAHSSARRIAAFCNQRVVAATEYGNIFSRRLSAVFECAHSMFSHSFLAMGIVAKHLTVLLHVVTSHWLDEAL